MQVLIRTILIGLASGSVYALASTGMVLTYKASGILNLGFGALALFTGFIHWQFAVVWGWPVWLSALLVIGVFAPLIGIFLDTQLFRRIEGQPIVIGVIATVGLTVLFQGLTIFIWKANPRFLPSLFPKGTVSIPGQGAQTWCLVHRDDVAEAYALALEHGKTGERFLLVDESAFTVREIGEAIATASGATAKLWPEEDVRRQLGPDGEALLMGQRATSAKARRELGWVPRHTSFVAEAAGLWREWQSQRAAVA